MSPNLVYEDFHRVAHPALRTSVVVDLKRLDIHYRDYTRLLESARAAPQGAPRPPRLPYASALRPPDGTRGTVGTTRLDGSATIGTPAGCPSSTTAPYPSAGTGLSSAPRHMNSRSSCSTEIYDDA